jgi:catecholate siderophore receptor
MGPRSAFRFNALDEDSGSFRQYVDLKRYAVNPTLTLVPAAETKITLGYEYLHDTRVADRGIPVIPRPAGRGPRFHLLW